MEQIGYVMSADERRAFVQLKRATACGENCANCSASCVPTKHTVSVANPLGATVGQTVKIEMASRSVITLAFVAYIVPIIMMLVGYALADMLFGSFLVSDISAIVCLLLTFWVLRRLDSGIGKKEKYQSKITKILE